MACLHHLLDVLALPPFGLARRYPADRGACVGEQPLKCDHCNEYNETISVSVLLDWEYNYFPFDRHDCNITLTLPESAIFGCERFYDQMVEEAAQDLILPTDGSWIFKGLEYDEYFEDGLSHCRIQLKVQRNSTVFFVKNILIIVIIVQARPS